jgi:integrase
MLRLTYRAARSKDSKKRGSYYIEGTDDRTGKRIHESLRTGDRDLAKRLFAKRVSEIATLRADGPMAIANFANAVKVYFERGRDGNSNEPYLSEMLPLIGDKRLCEITQADLDELAQKLRPKGSPATRKRAIYTPFIAAWNAAVRNEPPLAVRRNWQSPQPKRKAIDCPTDEYIARLTAACLETRRTGKRKNVTIGSWKPERDIAAVLFLTLTGCRSGEAQRLAVRDLDLENGRVLLRRTKNGKPRQVALAPALIAALRAQIAKLGEQYNSDTLPDALVFAFESRFGLPQMIRRARRRAGLAHYRPHEIGRHAFATRLLHNGASLLDVQKAGGWDAGRMVTEYYGHLAQEHVDQVVSGVDTSALLRPTPNPHPTSGESEKEPELPGKSTRRSA